MTKADSVAVLRELAEKMDALIGRQNAGAALSHLPTWRDQLRAIAALSAQGEARPFAEHRDANGNKTGYLIFGPPAVELDVAVAISNALNLPWQDAMKAAKAVAALAARTGKGEANG